MKVSESGSDLYGDKKNIMCGRQSGRKVNTVLGVMILPEDPGRFRTRIFQFE
jgi:hypothetical protein